MSPADLGSSPAGEPGGLSESTDDRLARARAVLAEAEAAAASPALPTPSRSGKRRSRGAYRAQRRSSGRGRGGHRSRSSESDGERPEASVDLSSWPGHGPAPDWVPDPEPTSTDTSADAPTSAEVATAGPVDAAGVSATAGSSPGSAQSDEIDPHEEEAEARQIVLRQLAMAPRSRRQLEDKLAAKEIDPHIAGAVLDRFTEVGLVDDEAFAEMLVRSQRETRGLAKKGLRHELRKKGIDPDIAEDALSSVDAESERARAEELVATRLRRLHGLPRDVQMRRLAGFLARKGYGGDIAYSVIRDAIHNAEEHGRD